MARPDQEAIETFMSITGASETVAVQKLEEHAGNLNAAVNAHFSEGDRNNPINVHETAVAAQNDFMDIDQPVQVAPREPPSLLSAARELMNPFSILDPNIHRGLFDISSDFASRAPLVTHPRERREIPIEVKDDNKSSGQSSHAPKIEDVTGTASTHGPDIRGTVIIDEEDDKDTPVTPTARDAHWGELKDDTLGDSSRDRHFHPSAPKFDEFQGNGNNDIEEEMIRAAIEASKWEANEGYPNQQFGVQDNISYPGPHLEDAELEEAVSLSLKTAEQDKALHGENIEGAKVGASGQTEAGMGVAESKGRLESGSSSIQDEANDLEEQPLVRNWSQHMSSSYGDPAKEVGVTDGTSPSSPGEQNMENYSQQNGNAFHTDEWGGISSEEHDEAVMLEAAMFGGIPEGTGYRFPYAPHQYMRNEGSFPRPSPRPPSPNLAAQRLIREQQDDEYLASLQADREKELKAMEEAEARREEERQKEEETLRKLEEEQELERQLAAKEASLPQEPALDCENAVTLLVRMPDGSRRGRRFLKSDKLQFLFDFIDIGRAVKPGSYRLVRPYPRRAFGDGESALTLNELGLASKQEALFLESV